MATHASAEKAARQAVKRNERNSLIKKNFRLEVKKFKALLTKKFESKENAKAELINQFKSVQKVLKRAANKKVIKLNNASRKISRLNKEMDLFLKKATA